MEMPNIKTTVKINNCVFEIYAYKKLSYAECKSEIRNWILQTNQKTIPLNGHFKIISINGFDVLWF